MNVYLNYQLSNTKHLIHKMKEFISKVYLFAALMNESFRARTPNAVNQPRQIELIIVHCTLQHWLSIARCLFP